MRRSFIGPARGNFPCYSRFERKIANAFVPILIRWLISMCIWEFNWLNFGELLKMIRSHSPRWKKLCNFLNTITNNLNYRGINGSKLLLTHVESLQAERIDISVTIDCTENLYRWKESLNLIWSKFCHVHFFCKSNGTQTSVCNCFIVFCNLFWWEIYDLSICILNWVILWMSFKFRSNFSNHFHTIEFYSYVD